MSRRRRTGDHFARRAKKEHYPARSIYKLEEIDRRVGLFKPGHIVLDLGAAPGSWTLFAAEKVGRKGRVVAVDRAPLTISLPDNAVAIEADALTCDPDVLMAETSGNGFNAVISDMAPKTSGHRFVDQSRSFSLFCRALEIAAIALRHNGKFVGKIFQGEDFEVARDRVRALFSKARVIRPVSVRSESYEIYLVGLGRR
ncbi:MAG: RlmE family RNA methyltransferase [Myxococcota bacterium]|nr:RlmE family RNA methyltransferase [Myxococcota bacterium]